MRQLQTILRVFGINCDKQIATLDVCRCARRPAFLAYAAAFAQAYRGWRGTPGLALALGHWPTATCVVTHVTGGASCASSRNRSERRTSMRRSAAS